MKILSAQQIREADRHTIEKEPISSIDLMERASKAFVQAFMGYYSNKFSVSVFCGVGNNGGDGLAISRLLQNQGYEVDVYVIGEISSASPDFKVNFERLPDSAIVLNDSVALPLFHEDTVIIDALFGSGLNRPLEGFVAKIVGSLNSVSNDIVSVDIASGLYSELPVNSNIIIQPALTISFQFPKLSFLQPELAKYVGEWQTVDIGLDSAFIEEVNTDFHYTEEHHIRSIYKPRDKYAHKGSAGKVQLWVGSKGSIGAAQLAATACLRAGVGLLFVKTPQCGEVIMQIGVPEAMVEADLGEFEIQSAEVKTKVDVIGIGAGIGTSARTSYALKEFLKNYDGPPLVLDADGINILAAKRDLLELLPEGSILTPHPGEFKRLVGAWENDYQKLDFLKAFCAKYRLNVVLKGAHSAVCDVEGKVYFNSTGNPGMATAGSGDVLFGVICGLLAGGMKPFDALRFGVFIHGRAGDLAKNKLGEESLIARDIIDFLSKSFLSIRT